MTPIEWAVVLGGLLTIAWINWYFFLAERASATAVAVPSGASGDGGRVHAGEGGHL